VCLGWELYFFIIHNIIGMFIIFSLECIKCVDVIVCFVCVIDKKNGIVDVVWSVGFDSGGGEFKPWLE